MAADLLLTGLTGLTAFKNVLNTTGHNIANVNTEGYSRQSVELATLNPQQSGAGFVGSGVETSLISRSYDSFLSTQFRSSSSASSELDAYFSFATQVDRVLAGENVGLGTALQDFFNAVQTVADDPTSIPARQALLTEGEVLQNRFGTLDKVFEDITAQLSGALESQITTVNDLARSIASLNDKIVEARGLAGGKPPNDLLDKRDLLVDQLSELVNVKTNEQENGALNVFIGNGQSLVLANTYNTLATQPTGFDSSAVDIVFQQKSGNVVVTQFMTGGEIGGALRFRNEVLDPSINTLGQLAVAVSLSINQQHKNGIDLDGQQGLDFFNNPTIEPIQLSGSEPLTATFTSTVDLTTSDYTFVSDGTNYTITRLSDKTQTTGALSDNTAEVDGVLYDFSALGAGVNSYRVRPTRTAAADFSLSLTDAKQVAAASPVVSEKTAANTGTGGLGSLVVTALETSTLATDVTLTYDSATKQYTVSNATGGPLDYDPAVDNGTRYTVNVVGFGDISFQLTGQPDDGDNFNITDNAGGVGDNRNALLLAGMQTSKTLSGGTAAFKDTYGQLVADVGRRTQTAEVNGAAQKGLLAQTVISKDSVSGVNLDEEAANLIRFQQAYQAASQVVLTSRTIFDTLIGVFR